MNFTPFRSASAFLGGQRKQRYHQIPASEEGREDEDGQARVQREQEREENHAMLHDGLWRRFRSRDQKKVLGMVVSVAVISTLSIVVIYLVFYAVLAGWYGMRCLPDRRLYRRLPDQSCDTVSHGYHCQPKISKYWGQYSPYFSVPSEISPDVPTGCTLTFAQVLSRHGARDPTSGKTLQYSSLIARIHNETTSYSKDFEFLKSYQYTLGADQLTPFGQQEMINSGAQFYARYADLTRTHTPFVRASGQQRVVESAQNWTQGFHSSRLDDELATSPGDFPLDILIIPETSTSNNTLSYGICTNFDSSPGSAAQSIYASLFTPPILSRIQENLPGANLTSSDAIALMDLCPFSTIAHPTGQISEICSLFTEAEWHAYDYYQTLGKFYGFMYPNPLGPTQGAGWVNELIARLTGSPVQDETSTNHTLDANEATFPLSKGGRGVVYADFSHDNDMSTMFAALGLYNGTVTPQPDALRDRDAADMDGYAAAYTVPFAARMYVEKMVCGARQDGGGDDGEEFVRVLVNDRVIPLRTCGGDELGRCTLDKFVGSLSFARSGGRWDQCFTE